MSRTGRWWGCAVSLLWAAGQVMAQEPVALDSSEPEEEPLPEVPALNLDREWIPLSTARQHLQAGRRVEALSILRDVLRRDVHHATALSLVATTLAEMGRQRDAVRLFQQLAQDYQQDYVVLNNLAWLLSTATDPVLRDPPEAVDLARQALLLAPENYSVWSTMAEAYYRNGRYDLALRAAEQALLLAQAQQAEGSRVATYAEQVAKSRQAVEAFTLVAP